MNKFLYMDLVNSMERKPKINIWAYVWRFLFLAFIACLLWVEIVLFLIIGGD